MMKYVIIIILSLNLLKAQVIFEESANQLGVFINCEYTYLGNGITFFDYDNDGWDDITVASAEGEPIYFLKNINGNFVSQTLNISDNNARNKQVNWVDIDNDGDNDLFITSDNSGIRLFENLGNMVMSEITSTSGMLSDNFPYYGASWGDYNNDGFLDIFLSIRDVDIPSILYKNNGDNTFTLANIEAGLLTEGFMSFCSVFIDYDNDGDQDIYVSNDKIYNPNLLYRNNGDGTFTEVGQESNTDLYIDAMTTTVGDINNDGWFDIYVTNDNDDSVLLLNNADGTFSDTTSLYGVSFNSIGWGALFLDADNDTDIDLYVSGETDGSYPQYLSSAFYENQNGNSFQLNNSAIPNDFAESYSNATGDINNDGFPDIIVNNINHENIFVWYNKSNNGKNWLKVKLEGTTSNRNGIGSFIEISVDGNKQYRYTCLGEGYLSQNSATQHFGLGNQTMIDYIKVKWLSGTEDILYNVTVNQTLNILEGSSLSVNQFDNSSAFTYYPNPVNNTLTLNAQNNIKNVRMYNMLGQEVMNAQPQAVDSDIDMSSLETGTYFVQVTIASITKTVRVVKQ
ncbi:FG-GAP-like repeat-containing protein [Winogradskyella sp. KYW1333]|uniref:FG-GAP-like repeat-containing protein n=1 Tax=Winogradskyella sp. KYW1333 TaxID=2282123 RepID=UPI000DF1F7BA|nr:FG-GAP-like repeat-containing protein [Winogradskyella sp. KYW1333]RCT54443.1 T9SS C-terminal target domain-containing protein [Winogradskyella sp. KYW1333]